MFTHLHSYICTAFVKTYITRVIPLNTTAKRKRKYDSLLMDEIWTYKYDLPEEKCMAYLLIDKGDSGKSYL